MMDINEYSRVITGSSLKTRDYHLDCPRCRAAFRLPEAAIQNFDTIDISGVECLACGLFIVIDTYSISPRIIVTGFPRREEAENYMMFVAHAVGMMPK
jgi:hypothetical protein